MNINQALPEEFIQQIPAIVAMFDTQFKFILASNLYRKEFDLVGVDLTGLSFFDIVDEENTLGKEIHKKCLEGKAYTISEFHLKMKSGKTQWYKVTLQPWFKNDKSVGGLIAFLENISFKKLAEREVTLKSQMLNGILNNIPVIVFKVNGEGVLTESIGSGLRVFGKRGRGSIGRKLFEIFPALLVYKEKIENRESFNYFIEGNHEGKNWYFQSYIFPDNVDNEGIIGFCFDITALKETEKDLKIAKEKSEAANLAKTRFLSSMSHEIRTPLNAILGLSNILKKEVDPSDQKAEYLEHISASGNILLKLIGDVLDLSRIEEGKLELNNEAFNFRKVISEGLMPYKYKANEKGLSFKLMFDDSIPDYVISDSNRINQILINIIGNALKFTKEGGIVVSFENETKDQKGEVIIKVSIVDTGIGISLDSQKKIFEIFTQADNTIVKEFGGTGLGLSIVRELLTLFGSQINVVSPANINTTSGGPGSTFWFTIAFQLPEQTLSRVVSSIDSIEEVRINKRILVAEDNEINQLVIKLLLEGKGYKVDIACNGEEVLDFINRNEYSLILMDIQMPLMDGYKATTRIRDLGSSIPVIALTANVYKDDIENCYNAGMNDFVGKPINEKVLYEKTKKWMI